MVFAETVLFFAFAFVVATACGYGVVTLLLPEEYRDLGFVIMPALGYTVYSWLAFTLSGAFDLPGYATTWLSAALLLVLGAASFFLRRRARPRLGEMALAFPVSALASLAMLWPLFYVGAQTYLGSVNPDYMATLRDLDYLEEHSLTEVKREHTNTYSHFYNLAGTAAKSARFGSSYFVILVKRALGIPLRPAQTVCIGFLMLCVPLSLYFMARAGLGFNRRAALIASALVAVSGPMTMSYVYFYLGQNSGLGVLPAVLTLLYLAVVRPSGRLLTLATLAVSGLYVVYTGIFPYAVAPVGLAVLVLALRGEAPLGRSVKIGAGVLAGTVALNLVSWRILAKSLSDWGRLITQSLQGQYFTDFLTEQFVPVFMGLVTYPAGGSIYGRRGPMFQAILFAVAALVVMTIVFIAVRWVRRTGFRGPAVLGSSAALVYGVVWYVYNFHRRHGYAVFKMTSWLQFIYVLPLAYGLDQAGAEIRAARSPRRRAGEVARLVVLATVVVANVVSSVYLGWLSLGRDTERGIWVNSYDMSGNYDYLQLAERVKAHVKPHETVAISFTDFIQQEWVDYYLRDVRLSWLSHALIHTGDDENLPDIFTRRVTDYYGNLWLDENFYFHGAADDYYLTWSDTHINRDIVQRRLPAPVWQDATFKLLKAADCPEFLCTGRGWYRLEFSHFKDWWWPDRYRWTAEGGEIYLLRAARPGEPYRLSFVGIVGHGRASERRTVELWNNTTKFDELEIDAAARVVSRPFRPTGKADRLVIKVKQRVEPLPRRFRLWNKDIPGDYRRLNLLVADVKVMPPEEPAAGSAPFVLSDAALFEGSVSFNGIQPNRWVGRSMTLEVRRPPAAGSLALGLFVPGHAQLHFPMTIRVMVDGREGVLVAPGPGPVSKVIPLEPSPGAGITRIEASSDQTYVAAGADMQNHPIYESFRLESVSFAR
jgi:hypothetical protein